MRSTSRLALGAAVASVLVLAGCAAGGESDAGEETPKASRPSRSSPSSRP
ncbi:hypothetical protein [Microbacterium sp. NIBRBAC000506063]|nr:hypothetical protein [Microbacterium sp. NIBRBAC000506063]